MQDRTEKRIHEKNSSGRPSGRCSKKRSRRRRHHSAFMMVIAGGFLMIAGILYLFAGMKYREHFFPNTVINGRDVSGMDIRQVKAAIDSEVEQYVLSIEERGGMEEWIHGDEIGIHAVYDGTLDRILEEQTPLAWGFHAVKGDRHEIKTMVSYEEEKLISAINNLACMNQEQVTAPADAHLAYLSGSGFQIIPEVPGNELIPEKFFNKVSEGIRNLESRIILDQLDVYKTPRVLKDDAALKAKAKAWKPYADVVVTYRFGSSSEILDGSTICQWLSGDSLGNVIIDRGKAAEYVKGLAKKYNTAYTAKQLKTSYGPTVKITKGHYGWMINQKAETEVLMEILYSGKSQEREPVYSQKAASHDGPDYGNTYVEMNLTAQHMYFYKNGKLLIESDFVSGDEAKGFSTPDGAYDLTYKQRNAVLKGKNYKTPVNYWMPFNGNIGMHDGYWRTSFGGTIYKKNGSHGCINLPPAIAKIIYENIEAGIPVLCYHLEGTERKAQTKLPENKKKAQENETTSQSQETPVQETPVQETPVQETPVQEVPNAGSTVSETPTDVSAAPGTPNSEATVTASPPDGAAVEAAPNTGTVVPAAPNTETTIPTVPES